MLTLQGRPYAATDFCDRLSRRNFLKIGTLGLGGLTLPQLLRAEARGRHRGSSHKSVIMIYLVGGPPHQDMFDLKPDAPQEIAGPWRPIATNVPGIRDLRGLPAAGADHGQAGRRSARWSATRPITTPSRSSTATTRASRRPPAAGRSSARPSRSCRGRVDPATPPFVSLCYTCTHGPYNEPGPGFLGRGPRPVPADGPDARRHGPARHHAGPARPIARRCLRSFDRFRRDADAERHDARHGRLHRAGDRTADVLAAGRGPRPVEGRPARSSPATAPAIRRCSWTSNGAPRVPQSLLLARRLIEAGARVVTLNYSKWDWHGGDPYRTSIFNREAEDFPVFDQCVSALVEDLHDRGLDKDCTVVVLGRVRPHAEDQRAGRPRPLAAGELRPAGRRRHEDRPGDRRDRPPRAAKPSPGRSRSAKCTPRSTTTSASTSAPGDAPRPQRPAAVPGRRPGQAVAGTRQLREVKGWRVHGLLFPLVALPPLNLSLIRSSADG